MLSVSNQDCSSITLNLKNNSTNERVSSVNCTSSLEETSLSVLQHSVTVWYNVENYTDLVVQPLVATKSYNCCANTSMDCYCINVTTSECLDTGGLTPELAGVVGGFIGLVITLLLTGGITGVIIGALMLVKRRKAIKRSENRPVLRTNSKIYRKRGQEQNEMEMTPESVVEDTLKPPSLPTARTPRQPPYHQNQLKTTQKNTGPLVPPNKPSLQSNYYTSQKQKHDCQIDSEFDDDDDDYGEPEETYETMFTADNVAYKNRGERPKPLPRNRQKQLVPEEFYDYLPT